MVKTDYKLANVCKFYCRIAQMRLPDLKNNSLLPTAVPTDQSHGTLCLPCTYVASRTSKAMYIRTSPWTAAAGISR